MIVDDFKKILDEYDEVSSNQNYVGNEFAGKIRNEFKNNLQKLVENIVEDKDDYHVKGNCGRLDWAANVNMRIGNKKSCRTFQIGLYLFYFFDNDNKGVYLSLDQGNNEPKKSTRIEIADKLIKSDKCEIPEGFVTDFSEGKLHMDAVMSKFYRYDELSEELLEKDLKALINVYESLIPDYLKILNEMDLNSVLDDINKDKNPPETEKSPQKFKIQFKNFQDFLEYHGYLFNKNTILNYLLSFKVKQFVILTGNSGTGKTKLAQLYAEYLNLIKDSSNTNLTVKNYALVPIGANWTDNRNILGFENIITNTYQSTPALELILKASNNLNNPYFLILDEMNLSHVERYFSDFLSAIESKEAIELYSLNKIDNGKEKNFKVTIDEKEYIIPNKLEIPSNLFIVGTVNVDETTYMFSPKVLDRANVLEFETCPVFDYLEFRSSKVQDEEYNPSLETSLITFDSVNNIEYDLKNITYSDFKSILCETGNEDMWDELANELAKFQLVLKESGFDFGFRVVNEIIRFIIASLIYLEGDDENKLIYALDTQIKQKILPKLHGSENVIKDTLDNLFKLSYYGNEIEFNHDAPESLFEVLNKFDMPDDIINAKYIESAKKLNKMIKILDKQRYVSFIN